MTAAIAMSSVASFVLVIIYAGSFFMTAIALVDVINNFRRSGKTRRRRLLEMHSYFLYGFATSYFVDISIPTLKDHYDDPFSASLAHNFKFGPCHSLLPQVESPFVWSWDPKINYYTLGDSKSTILVALSHSVIRATPTIDVTDHVKKAIKTYHADPPH